jgi:hypothetical protein
MNHCALSTGATLSKAAKPRRYSPRQIVPVYEIAPIEYTHHNYTTPDKIVIPL